MLVLGKYSNLLDGFLIRNGDMALFTGSEDHLILFISGVYSYEALFSTSPLYCNTLIPVTRVKRGWPRFIFISNGETDILGFSNVCALLHASWNLWTLFIIFYFYYFSFWLSLTWYTLAPNRCRSLSPSRATASPV